MNQATRIVGTGSVIPEQVVPNDAFLSKDFLDEKGQPYAYPNDIIIEKFQKITEITSRRYLREDQVSSDIGAVAAQKAIEDAGWDPETIDLLIVGQNFGDIAFGTRHMDQMPSISSRVKEKLGISNPNTVAFDVLAGCPGWIQGVQVAHAYFSAGMAKRAVVVGCDALSRTVDKHDRDQMIFADGAGAACIERQPSDDNDGIIGMASKTFTKQEAFYLKSNPSFNPELDQTERLIKMKGRKVYEFAIRHVPYAMKDALDHAGVDLKDVKKIFMHQANAKLDHAVGIRLYKLYGMEADLDDVMPMSIHWLGNSSVATVPTLLDMVIKENYEGHSIAKGDILLFASVGAGMNVNALVYKV